MFEFNVFLCIEHRAVCVENGQLRNAALQGDAEFCSKVDIRVEVLHVDVNLDEVLGEETAVRRLLEVEIEDVAVAAPVAAEVDEDALVLAAGSGDRSLQVFVGGGGVGVDVLGAGELGGGGESR